MTLREASGLPPLGTLQQMSAQADAMIAKLGPPRPPSMLDRLTDAEFAIWVECVEARLEFREQLGLRPDGS